MKAVKLSEISQMKYGRMPDKNILTNEGYPIFSGYRITGYCKEYLYKEPMLIVVARGVGGTGDVKIAPQESWITNLSIVLMLNKDKIDQKYLYYKLGLEPLKEKLNTGAAQAQITIESLSQYSISIHDREAQKRIAQVASNYDELIENNTRQINLLEEAARQLYKEWFVRLRFPGHEHVKVVNGVPEGWISKPLGKITRINQTSIGKSFSGFIRYIDIASVSSGSINEIKLLDFRDAPSRARRIVRHGDIIWSCVRPNLRAHAVIWNPTENLIASTGFAVITPVNLPTSFIYQAITTDQFVGYLQNNAKGAAYPAVVASDFERAIILVPPDSLLKEFDDFAAPLLTQINILRSQNEKLTEARDLLLPRLMNGEIRV